MSVLFEVPASDRDEMRPFIADGPIDIRHALALIWRFKATDGAHHKDWLLDQVTRVICGERYSAFVEFHNTDEDDPDAYSWDEGIIP